MQTNDIGKHGLHASLTVWLANILLLPPASQEFLRQRTSSYQDYRCMLTKVLLFTAQSACSYKAASYSLASLILHPRVGQGAVGIGCVPRA